MHHKGLKTILTSFKSEPSVGENSIYILLTIFNKIKIKFKNNKILRFLVFLIAFTVIFFGFKLILPYINNVSTIILIKFNELDSNKIVIPEYLPKFFKSYFI